MDLKVFFGRQKNKMFRFIKGWFNEISFGISLNANFDCQFKKILYSFYLLSG